MNSVYSVNNGQYTAPVEERLVLAVTRCGRVEWTVTFSSLVFKTGGRLLHEMCIVQLTDVCEYQRRLVIGDRAFFIAAPRAWYTLRHCI